MSCVVAGLRYYFRIYKYEYLGELMTSELHIYIILYYIIVSGWIGQYLAYQYSDFKVEIL